MSFFGNQYGSTEAVEIKDVEGYQEACMIMELMSLSDEEFTAVTESASFQVLEEKGLIGRRTIVKLRADDDLTRRETMAAFQLAKEADDPLWSKLAMNRVKERDLIGQIQRKYGSRATRVAKQTQKEYIKKIRQGGTVTKNEIDNRM